MSSFTYLRQVPNATKSRIMATRQASRAMSVSGKVSKIALDSRTLPSLLSGSNHISPSSSSTLSILSNGSGVLGTSFTQTRTKYFLTKKGGHGSRRNSNSRNTPPKSPLNDTSVKVRISKDKSDELDVLSKHLIPLNMSTQPTQRKYHAEYSYKQNNSDRESPSQILHETMKSLKNPRMISTHLDEYVIGQEEAKKILSVAVFNHYKRLQTNLSPFEEPQPVVGDGFKVISNVMKKKTEKPVLDKSNVLLIGPTGSGKTLLAKTLAQILHVPFSMNDATPFTQAGYVGEDVEVVVQRLLQNCDHNVKLAEQGIVFIDEIDKIARKSTDGQSQSRDVSGEGVQQSLLRILEGTTVSITEKNVSQRPGSNVFGGNKAETYSVNTTNVLFILSGAFVGLEKIIADRMSKSSIGFNAVVRSSSSTDFPAAPGMAPKSNLNPLLHTDPTDLIKFGFIPEFIGRVPVIAPVSNLTEDSLVRILTEPKNSLTKQYESLFQTNQVKLILTEGALHSISRIAITKQSGARGLRRIMENILLNPMYDVPESRYRYVVINKDVINATLEPMYFTIDQHEHVLNHIMSDDGTISPRLKAVLKRNSE